MMNRLLVLVAVCLFPPPAVAEVVPFDASYSLLGLGQIAPVGMGSGVAEVNPSGAGGTHLTHLGLPGGIATVMTTGAATVVTIADGPGTFVETTSGRLRGALPITGNVRFCLDFPSCLFFQDVPLTENGTRGVGLGGPPITRMLGGTAVLSLQGATWSTGTLTGLTTGSGATTVMGHAHGSASQASSTAVGMGAVQMVTPITVTATQGGSSTALDLFGVMNLQLMPEPTRGLLLCCGAMLLGSFGVFQRRKRPRVARHGVQQIRPGPPPTPRPSPPSGPGP